MARRTLIDTSAIYALVARNDPNHDSARRFVEEAIHGKVQLVLLDLIFAETMTLLKSRITTAVAITVGHQLRSNPHL